MYIFHSSRIISLNVYVNVSEIILDNEVFQFKYSALNEVRDWCQSEELLRPNRLGVWHYA